MLLADILVEGFACPLVAQITQIFRHFLDGLFQIRSKPPQIATNWDVLIWMVISSVIN